METMHSYSLSSVCTVHIGQICFCSYKKPKIVPMFPLLRLPNEELHQVVKTMDILDRISISLVSKTTKSVVITCRVDINCIYFTMDHLFDVHLQQNRPDQRMTWCLSQKHTDREVELKPAKVVKVTDWSKPMFPKYQWKKEGFEIKDWIKHFQDITRISYISEITFYDIRKNFNVDSVARLLKMFEVKCLVVSASCSSEYCHAISQKVYTDRTWLIRKFFPEVVLEKVLIQNRNRVDGQAFFPIKLNDILMMNCEVFSVTDPRGFSMKAFNRFLKIWKAGFNRRLRRFEVIFLYEDFPQDALEILNGIDHIEVTPERFNFRGANGSRATLMIEPRACEIALLISE